ncbi:MAG: hypothetical protein HYV41_05260, partial [Candidatus Magasanikbacteria bacterium]|nr:hypothetical protein [Candidatus Magasanikbacteria bacterium]
MPQHSIPIARLPSARFKSDTAKNTDRNCYSDAYCYSNVAKLRRARIVPLGFEIAVARSSPDKPDTLGEVVAGFNNCPKEGESFDSATHRFCHLIDPNWIIKAPEARCESEVNGPMLMADGSSERNRECADISTCLKTDASGSCIAYGYCMQEKNIWKLPGASCPSYYNTCKTYTNTEGSYASYLSRSIEYGTCNIESVGCSAYSTEQVNSGQWLGSQDVNISDKVEERQDVLFFNQQVGQYSCPESQNGCTLFLNASSTEQEIYAKKAPNYLGCYDTNPSTLMLDWPETKADLQLLADIPEACTNFAGACIPEEIGCQIYTPKDGGTHVTGIVGANYCPSQCVGYETFKQESTNFEAEKFPKYFVPSTGQSCSAQYAGCDEFTNISDISGEQLEYYSDLKICQIPDGNNAKVFYSWEGSESQGYILKKHNLAHVQTVNDIPDVFDGSNLDFLDNFKINSPLIYYNTNADVLGQYNLCNQATYNQLIDNPYSPLAAHPDCRALYDSLGNIYYRLLDKTISVSPFCQKYRKTDSQMYVDIDVVEPQCTNKGGLFKANKCMRCFDGGIWKSDTANPNGGACIYYSIPSEATSCPASANSCRMYIGNTGQNIHEVYSTSFEPVGNTETSLADAKAGWVGTVVPEATQVGLYSLKMPVFGGDTWHDFEPGIIKKGLFYELTFWARGEPQSITIKLTQVNKTEIIFTQDPLTKTAIPAPVTLEWQEYRIGPILSTHDTDATTTLVFDTSGNKTFFLDNIRLTSLGDSPDDYIPLIKDSWKTAEGYEVPLSCDSSPFDAYPGEALGCRAYTEGEAPTTQEVTITGFEKLCRAEAVGCRPVIDTQNTEGTSDEAKAGLVYNALCTRGTDATEQTDTVCQVNFDDNKKYSCTFEKGKDACFIKGPVYLLNEKYTIDPTSFNIIRTENSTICTSPSLPQNCTSAVTIFPINTQDQLQVVSSTVVIPADSPVEYLAIQQQNLCSLEYMGCQQMGREEHILPGDFTSSYAYSDTYLLNDPAHYTETLCTQAQLGCSEFKHTNTIEFFKDPVAVGSSLCVYKTGVELQGVETSGWFMDGVGVCKDGSGSLLEAFCKSDTDCHSGDTCVNIGQTACYPDYIKPGPEYGLWSNASENYQNFVGVCSDEYSGCTELIDPADTSGDPEGKPYYAINDDTLFAETDQCEGKISQKEGCVLFDMTENPNKIYASTLTYAFSKAQQYALVKPMVFNPNVSEESIDTNTIIKVRRDRECSKWLSCRDSYKVTDAEGIDQKICSSFQACNQLDANGDCIEPIGWIKNNTQELLTFEKYMFRNVSWSDPDYSGFSLYNKYDPSHYVYLTFPHEDLAYLAFEMNTKLFDDDPSYGCGQVYTSGQFSGQFIGQLKKEQGQVCGFDAGGRCYGTKCLYPIDGVFSQDPEVQPDTPQNTKVYLDTKDLREAQNIGYMLDELEPGTCKAHPESSGPFDARIAIDGPTDDIHTFNSGTKTGNLGRKDYKTPYGRYSGANVCQINEKGELQDCACDYIKVEYKNGVIDYWHTDDADEIADGVCSGNTGTEGKTCSSDSECNPFQDDTGGVCNRQAKKGKYLGLKGLCLEYDTSRPLGPYVDKTQLQYNFPCLTWFPIQVSASNVDIYNSNPATGYLPEPDFDSPNSAGRVYCTEMTSFGRGYYDDTFADSYWSNTNYQTVDSVESLQLFTQGFPDYFPAKSPKHGSWNQENYFFDYFYNQVINVSDTSVLGLKEVVGPLFDYNKNIQMSTGGKKVDIASQSMFMGESLGYNISIQGGCITIGTLLYPSAYAKLMRDGSIQDLYRTMQVWAWKNLGQTARIMRLDSTNGCGPYYFDEYNQGKYTAAVFGFAPRGDVLDPNGAGDSGTLMHPPRLWIDKQINVLNEADVDQGRKYYTMNSNVNQSDIQEAETSAFSPELTNKNARYRDTEFEKEINEYNLKRVYFVPLAYPGGAEGANPPLLTPEFRIDLQDLRDIHNKNTDSDPQSPILGRNSSYVADDNWVGFSSIDHTDNAYIVEYMLQNNDLDECNNNTLESYCDYSTHIDISKFDTIDDLRNTIYRRYVTLFYFIPAGPGENGNGGMHPFDFGLDEDGANLKLPLEERDPFQASCKQGDSSHDNNWIAIGMDFNKDGEFLGYISRFCDGAWNEDAEGGGIRFATIAELQDTCTQLVSVYDDNKGPAETSNKAWTDRVWQGGGADSTWVDEDDNSVDFSLFKAIKKDTLQKPFGSLALPAWATINLTNNSLESAVKSKLPPPELRYMWFPYFASEFGVPYSCYGGSTISSDSSENDIFSLQNSCDGLLNMDKNEYIQPILGNSANGFASLHNLFAYFFNVVDTQNIATKVSDLSNTIVQTGPNATFPPRIFALDPYLCTADGETCAAAYDESTITVNNRNYTDTDYNKDGDDTGYEDANNIPGVDPIIGSGSLKATVKFFANADKNRMPIRRVKYDWGDGTISNDTMGMFQNHLPVCNNTDFSYSARGCIEKFFESDHIYFCDDPDLQKTVAGIQDMNSMFPDENSKQDAYKTLKTAHGLNDDSKICIFKPGVQVLDN